MLKAFFEREGIRFYRELPASALRIIDKEKYSRMAEKIGGVQSCAVFLIPYYTGQKTTNLSVYAQVRDYHRYITELSERFRAYQKEIGEDLPFMGYTDTSPVAERMAALTAGLGFLGENGLVLNRVYGSFFFIGEFFFARAVSPESPLTPQRCPGCGKCLAACPTGAIRDPERKKCLSHLSQKKHLTPEEKALVDKAACKWGCDLCQNVCPFNQNAEKTPIPYFRTDLVEKLDHDAIEAPKEEFQKRAYAWRGRNVLRLKLGEQPKTEDMKK